MMKFLVSKQFIAFLAIFCITLQCSPIAAIQRPTNIPTYTNFLKTSCKATVYPVLCYNSLSTYSSVIQTSPRMLANASLSVTLSTTKTTTAMIHQMSNGPGMRPREASAMRDCLEELKDALNELQSSIKEMGHMRGSKDVALTMNNIETWVSGAMTDENTCMDGFGGKVMDGKLKNVVRGKIMIICHLTSNSLALINGYASSMGL